MKQSETEGNQVYCNWVPYHSVRDSELSSAMLEDHFVGPALAEPVHRANPEARFSKVPVTFRARRSYIIKSKSLERWRSF